MKLFRITLRGMTYSTTGVIHGVSYVVAEDPTSAYKKVRDSLDTKGLGSRKDRELDKIELIAGSYDYTYNGHILYL